jgi:hypothetical protein
VGCQSRGLVLQEVWLPEGNDRLVGRLKGERQLLERVLMPLAGVVFVWVQRQVCFN